MHFKRRGYPNNILLQAIISLCRTTRDKSLTYKEEKQDADECLLSVSAFTPGFDPPRNIIKGNWDLLMWSSVTKILAETKVIFGHRRPPNLKDSLVRAKLPLIDSPTKKRPYSNYQNRCSNFKGVFCPMLNKSGGIKSTKLGGNMKQREMLHAKVRNWYIASSVKLVTNNILVRPETASINDFLVTLVLLEGKTCKKMHKSTPGLSIHLQIEFNWVHRLRCMLPFGINTKDKTPSETGCRNWRHYRANKLMQHQSNSPWFSCILG